MTGRSHLEGDLCFADYRLDRRDERLWRSGVPVKLGPKAFRVLLMLVEQQGRLLTKDDLFTSVWDGTIVSESSLTSVIKELRRALGDESKTPRFIESVYGRGYRFLPQVNQDAPGGPPQAAAAPGRGLSVCVLPFENMSGDIEQDYFSDGISEDIITDLSKVSSLSVTARHTAFTFRGKAMEVRAVARQLGVSHVLEGSVRKVGARVRITAQLNDGAAGDQVWAERWDRDLTDIFAIQDEISTAVVRALKLTLLPEEKIAIEQRGTTSPQAYDLYLLARQYWISGNDGDSRRDEIVVRICAKATDLDPGYARAWALKALAQTWLKFRHGKDADGLAAAERALLLDPELAEAHCVKARYLFEQGRWDEVNALIETALRLDPASWEVNKEAAMLIFRQGRIDEAVRHFEKAAELMGSDIHARGMMTTCYRALGDRESEQRTAREILALAEKVRAQDPNNGAALGWGANALIVLGEAERAKTWIERALLIDAENWVMRYNLACVVLCHSRDADTALVLLDDYFANVGSMKHSEVDPDLDRLRDHPRFKAMVAAANARLAGAADSRLSAS
jgi:adenylate cyclase